MVPGGKAPSEEAPAPKAWAFGAHVAGVRGICRLVNIRLAEGVKPGMGFREERLWGEAREAAAPERAHLANLAPAPSKDWALGVVFRG